MNRRLLLFSLVLCTLVSGQVEPTWADDDGSNSGSGGSSGSGNGGDDNDDEDDEFDEDKSGSDRARDAVQTGRAVPLRRLLAHLREFYPGKVLDIDLRPSKSRHSYRVIVLTPKGKVEKLRLDALTLQRL